MPRLESPREEVRSLSEERSSHVDELGLDGGGMDSLVMEEILHIFGNGHVFRQLIAANVSRADELRAAQSPDVQFVNTENTGDLGETSDGEKHRRE